MEKYRPDRAGMAQEKVEQKRLAKEQAAFRVESTKKGVEAAQKSLEAAQKSMEAAIAADLEAAQQLHEAQQEYGKMDQAERIQKIVDERQERRVRKDFDGADRLLNELRSMGVQVNDKDLSWTGPDGLTGAPRRKEPPKPKGGGRGRRSPSRGRRSPSRGRYERYEDRGRDRGRDRSEDKKKRRRYDDSSSSPSSPPRRRR